MHSESALEYSEYALASSENARMMFQYTETRMKAFSNILKLYSEYALIYFESLLPLWIFSFSGHASLHSEDAKNSILKGRLRERSEYTRAYWK